MAEIIDFAAKREARRLAALNKAVVQTLTDDIVFIESLPSVDYFTASPPGTYKIEINAPAAASDRYCLDKPCDTE